MQEKIQPKIDKCPPLKKAKNKPRKDFLTGFVLALPIFPGRRQPSIVSRIELNFRVRDGNGWTLDLINTNYHNCSLRTATHIVFTFHTHVNKKIGDPYGIRTHVKGVRGLCLNHLTNGPNPLSLYAIAVSCVTNLVHLQGLEPWTP